MKTPVIYAVFAMVVGFGPCSAFDGLQWPEPDADDDEVPDVLDRCPNTAQLKKLPRGFRFGSAVDPDRLKPGPQAHAVDLAGCELDNDGDGVANSQGYCPDDSAEALIAGTAANGCPSHSDFDGTPDYRDRCPGTGRGIPRAMVNSGV
jgi:OOP family OmpA-OmpF porin